MYSDDILVLVCFAALALLVVWATVFSQRRRARSHSADMRDPHKTSLPIQATQSSSVRHAISDGDAQRKSDYAEWMAASLLRIIYDGKKPDSVLRGEVYTSDGYYDILIGAFQKEQFLRFVMRGDNCHDSTDLHSWDSPYETLFQVILRWRSEPGYPLQAPGPDGSHRSKLPYFETRLYKIGRGIECRLIDRNDMFSEEPFQWFRTHLADAGIQFAGDSEDEPLYGDTSDKLAEYMRAIKSRADIKEDQAAAAGVLNLSKERIAELRKASFKTFPDKVRAYLESGAYWDDLGTQLSRIKDADGNRLSRTFTDYTKRVLELMLVRAISTRYCPIFFYDNFPRLQYEDDTRASTKEELSNLIRWTINKFVQLGFQK